MRYFELSRSDPALAHEMYHGDAVLEFPQSGERFVGVENFREWRSTYPGSVDFEVRESNLGVSIMEFQGDKVASETIYVTEPWEAPEWRAKWRATP